MTKEVECIKAEQYPNLTNGKKYKVEYIREDGVVFIIDDKKQERGFKKDLFNKVE